MCKMKSLERKFWANRWEKLTLLSIDKLSIFWLMVDVSDQALLSY